MCNRLDLKTLGSWPVKVDEANVDTSNYVE